LKRNAKADVDVAVLGGGPAGAATAIALRRRGHSAVVIESSGYGNVRVGEPLPPRIRIPLVTLGVWEQFAAETHVPAPGIRSAWGQDDLYDNDFLYNPYGVGWHVDRGRFDSMLARCAEDAGAIVYRQAALLSCLEDDNGDWHLELAENERRHHIRAGLIVDATGRASSFAQKQGVRRIPYDRLIGVIGFATRRTPEPEPSSFTLIEAVESGWWYSTVLPGSRAVAAYMTDSDLWGNAQRRESDYWLRQLRRTLHIEPSVSTCTMDDSQHVVAANTSRLERLTGRNWLAVGDAAMAFDPLSGQGVFKALQSALKAADAIDQRRSGSEEALPDYEAAMTRDFDEYQRTRNTIYGKEQRWPEAPFWQRRQPHETATASPADP